VQRTEGKGHTSNRLLPRVSLCMPDAKGRACMMGRQHAAAVTEDKQNSKQSNSIMRGSTTNGQFSQINRLSDLFIFFDKLGIVTWKLAVAPFHVLKIWFFNANLHFKEPCCGSDLWITALYKWKNLSECAWFHRFYGYAWQPSRSYQFTFLSMHDYFTNTVRPIMIAKSHHSTLWLAIWLPWLRSFK